MGAAVQGATLYDGWEDLRLVPAPVNITGGWTDSVAVTADGRHLYFGYTKYDVSEFFIVVNGGEGELFNPTGPTRAGMIGDKFQIFRADLGNSGWSVHYHPVNADSPNVTQASASVNEAQDLMVFSRFDEEAESAPATLWFSQLSAGTWSEPVDLQTIASVAINAGCPGGGDDNGFVFGDLTTSVKLAWESRRTSAVGDCGTEADPHHLYWTTFTPPGTWSAIEAVPGLNDFTSTPESDDTQLSFSPDGQTAYWTSIRMYESALMYGLFTADWDGSTFTNVRPVIKPTYSDEVGLLHVQGELNVAEMPEGWIGYLMCGIANSNTPHDIDLHVCRMRKPR